VSQLAARAATLGPKPFSEAQHSEQHQRARQLTSAAVAYSFEALPALNPSSRCGCESDRTDVGSLSAFRALRRAELDPLTFIK
jgi:hypothetical protein